MNKSNAIIIAIIIVVGIAAIGYWHYFLRGSTPPPDKPAELITKHAPPEITEIHQLSKSTVEIIWFTPVNSKFSHNVIHGWSQSASYRSPEFAEEITSAQDHNDKIIDEVYFYYVESHFSDGTTSDSEVTQIEIKTAPELSPPENLSATWTSINNQAYAKLSWQEPQNVDLSEVRGYIIYSDVESIKGLLSIVTYTEKRQVMERLVKLTNTSTKEINFAVASVGITGNQSQREYTAIEAGISAIEAPTAITATRADDGKLIVAWDYQPANELQGFRLYRNGFPIEIEQNLSANLREWQHTLPPLTSNSSEDKNQALNPDESINYRFQLSAISNNGLESDLSEDALIAITVKEHPVYLAKPINFISHWQEKDNQLQLFTSWTDSWPSGTASRYKLETTNDDGQTYQLVAEVGSIQPVYFIPSDFNNLRLKLTAIALDGVSTTSINIEVADPKKLLPMTRLLKYELKQAGDQAQLTWHWRYPDLSILKGFRIYQNQTLIADENTIQKNQRSWQTPPIASDEIAEFEIEAVSYGNIVSPRGPKQVFTPLPSNLIVH